MTKIGANRRHATSHGRGSEPGGSHRGEPALELLDARVPGVASAESGECGQVASVGVDGPRRTTSRKQQQEALDVGIGGTHGAEPDSANRRLLLCATVTSGARKMVAAEGIRALDLPRP